VKPAIDIVLKTIHVGECRKVVTLSINGKDLAEKFLQKLNKDDSRKWAQMTARIAFVSNFPTYENNQNLKSVGNGIYEFKRPGLRLYAFYDQIGDEHQLILCTNGGSKNTQKEQQADIARAKSLRQQYLAAKESPDAHFTFEELEEDE
jgi:putative component of toxin-antitoxin plasmid stabilization module